MLIFILAVFMIMITNFQWITKMAANHGNAHVQQWNPYLMTALKYLLRYFS